MYGAAETVLSFSAPSISVLISSFALPQDFTSTLPLDGFAKSITTKAFSPPLS